LYQPVRIPLFSVSWSSPLSGAKNYIGQCMQQPVSILVIPQIKAEVFFGSGEGFE
jgi:hypothetical protein